MELVPRVGALILSAVSVQAATVFKGVDAYPELLKQCQENTWPMDTVEECVRFSATKPPPLDLWTKLCLGKDEMGNDYRIQKAKYCECMHAKIFYEQPDKSFKSSVQVCKEKYPPLQQ